MKTLSAPALLRSADAPAVRAPDIGHPILKPEAQVLAFIALSTIFLVLLALVQEPDPIEAYHWLYAQHPAAGYFDHPGMIGWLVALSTAAGGDSLLALRFPTIVGSALMIWLAFLAGRRMYDARTGRLAAFLIGLVPLTARFAMEAAPDGPLLAFWMATLWSLSHAVPGDGPGWWLLSGLFAGAAMDSKYSAVLLPAGLALFLAASREHRFWWKRWEPYGAGAMALAVFAPTVLWNASHGWQSFAYQGVDRIRHATGIRFSHAFSYFRRELVLVTPFVAAGVVGAAGTAIRFWRRSSWGDRLAVSVGAPILVGFSLLAFTRSVRAHWPAPAYLSLIPLSAAFVLRRGGWWRRLYTATVAVLAAGGLAYVLMSALRPDDASWAAVDDQVRRIRPAFVISSDYHDAAELAWRLRPVSSWNLAPVGLGGKAFRTWWTPELFRGRDAAVVLESPGHAEELEAIRLRFRVMEGPVCVDVPRRGAPPKRMEIWTARGYQP